MQSLTQTMKSGSKPAEIEAGRKQVTTEISEQPSEIKTGAQPIESETEAQVVENNSAVFLENETVITADENETVVQPLGGETAQTPGSVSVTQAAGNDPAVQPMSDLSHNTGGMPMDTTSKPSAPTALVPDTPQNLDCGVQEVDKVPDGRKCIPSKKDRLDPLKMDMSKPVVMPLTSSQLSLQCIECHIIFSDHKSKERHLKLSHPAEYEQCILRNALFACYVCDRHFTNSIELMAHQKAHIEKKPFKCPICGQAFNKSSELTLHKKIHFGRDGYACSDCGKPCKTLTLLKYHRRTHTGERPYVCKECGKRFSMSKTLQKHIASHLPEGTEGDGGDTSATAKAPLKKNNDASTIKYPCSVCKATFKTTKTRLHHMKNKHNMLPAATTNALPAAQLVKQGTPIITPISICQPTLLQVEPIGPLQQVDANIDTEQIRRLIESLGNVQKVNQVVILGQVPPHAPPMELQQISELGEAVHLNFTPQQLGEAESQMQTVRLDEVNSVIDGATVEEMHEKPEQEPSEKLLVDSRESQEQLEKVSREEDTSTKEEVLSQLETKQGHKQPQLKVYKLDPSKASGQKQEPPPHEFQTTSQRSKDITRNQRKDTTTESANKLTAGGKKKGGRPKKNQKALSLLSSLQLSPPPSDTLPTKPKTTRKRKASSKVETEGVITSSHSRRALECKDCGERFSEVSSLQEHKATVHIVESPGLTYTNGNIFEGVSRLDLCQPPKLHNEVIGVMNAATDWDTEAEMGEMALEDRERSVSFPALNPSPSLPVTAPDAEASGYEDKSGNTAVPDIASLMGITKEIPESQCLIPPEVLSPCPSKADQMKILESKREAPPCLSSNTPLNSSTQTKGSEAGWALVSDEGKTTCQTSRQDIPKNPLLPSSESEVQGATDEDIKEGLLVDVDLVTVGEQNERNDPNLAQECGSQIEPFRPRNPESGSTDTLLVPPGQMDNETTTETSLTSQTVSCSTHQPEIKEEEEEILVQRKEEGARGAVRGRRRGTGRLRRGVMSRRNSVGGNVRRTEPEKELDECQVVYEKHPRTSDSEINESETSTPQHTQSTSQSSQPEMSPTFEPNKGTASTTSVPSVPSSLEESPGEQVVFELESVTTSVVEVMKSEERLGLDGGEEQDSEAGQSPGVILERFLTSRQRETADKEQSLMAISNNQRQGLDSNAENEVVFREVQRGQEIKVEENISDPPLVAHTCHSRQRVGLPPQNQHDIRTVLVKQESCLILNDAQATQGSRHIRWNVEQINIENASGPLIESDETTSSMAPDLNSNQCIFYPVKEEEREVLLGGSQSDDGVLTVGVSSDARIGQQTEHRPASINLHEGSHATEDYQETRVRGTLSGAGVNDFANTEAVADIEWQDRPQLRDFLLQSSDEEDSDVFELPDPHLDSEAEAMACYYKNQNSSPPQPDETSHNLPTPENQLHSHSLREGSRGREPIDYFSKYFGWDTWVEIAQCTNKLSNMPNPVTAKEIAQFVGIHIAMGTLKFPSLKLYWQDFTKVPLIAEAMPLSQFLQLSRKLKLASPAKDPINNVGEERNDWDKPNELNCSNTQTDPLWRVQPLLCRFQAGCLLLRREGDYGVDQYPLPLTTGKISTNKPSLHCTTLIGFDGLVLHLDLKLDLSDKEDAVEKMAPRGSMVFLCKQELSTPAMLERLLVAGVHGAGRVGGAMGQIGDEFISSDGRLMLRRSHHGFILSTVGNGQRNMASLTDNFEKAQMSARLNRDLQNLYRIPLTASAPTCWPQAVLWYLTDLALVNSWLLYRQDHGPVSEPVTLMAFRLEVSKALILSSGSDTQDSVPPQPPTQKAHAASETPNPNLLEESPLPDAATRYDGSGHWPEQLGEGEGGRCRFGGCERTSRVLCLKCCVFLCISRNHNCFLNFHNQGNLGNE
ncbi:zinc finger protein 576, tandem duplicate 1 [Centroberyx affinis]|uniref:zinc finger protein 576, tandem duplicate 1 n=1 Tax=Centroberyx affinis TaxID=166261 RepID=UPI003A5BBDCF